MSPILGAYGDQYANTPTLDHLATQSSVYGNAFANVPVCAPARLTLMTGMNAASALELTLSDSAPTPRIVAA